LPVFARRGVALVIVPVAVLTVTAAILVPVTRAREAQDEWREEARRLLAASKRADALKESLDEQIAAVRASPLWSKLYSSTGGAPLASALQSDIGMLLSRVDVSAQTLTPIAAQELPLFIRAGARITASMRVDQLRELMAALATHPRYLRVERLTIDAPRTQIDTENPPLAVTAEIYGYELR
jgi:hypothetical protein